jgi:UMF1 family MFS transporter
MMIFAFLTAVIGACLLFVVDSSMYILAFVIFIISNTTFGASYVFNYSWVPVLTHYSPEVIAARENPNVTDEEFYAVSDQKGNEISSKGFFYGYVSSTTQLVLAAAFAVFFKDTFKSLTPTYQLQICIAATCIFQICVLAFYCNKLVKSRPGPPLPKDKNPLVFSIQNSIVYLK